MIPRAVYRDTQKRVKKGPRGAEDLGVQCVTVALCLSLPAVIPKVTKHLLSNPVFTCIILAACMEIAVVAGFAAFLGKYLEQQFNLTTSSANQLLGESTSPSPGEGRGLLSCV